MRTKRLCWIFFVSVFVGFPWFHFVLVSGQCQSDQRAILLRLRNELDFNSVPSEILDWNRSRDCCKWLGVTCDVGGRVTGLNLSAKSISGGVDNTSSLFELQHLQTLDLSYNSFMFARIPSQIGKLENLAYLNLSNSGFGGQIPFEVSQLSKLVSLDLSMLFPGMQSLKLESPNLAVLVGNLTRLVELYLDGVNISWRGQEWCEALSSSLPNLQVLTMSNCYLSGPIDSSLRKLRNLTAIRLDNNNFSIPFPDIFGEFPNLVSLKLSHCNFSGKLPRNVFYLRKLQMLDVSNNILLQGRLQDFPINGSLEVLALSFTSFSGSLPDGIDRLTSISRIELSNCSFGGEIPSSIEKLEQLVYLDFSFNQFNGSMPSFAKSRNLTQLILSHNDLSGVIPANWVSLEKLVNLDLRNNKLSGRIPSSLFALPSMQKIQLSGNNFSGPLTISYPKMTPSQLETLDLSNNSLQEQIPDTIFQFRSLKILMLASNNFSGSIQLSRTQRLENLTNLDLSYNRLSVVASGSAFSQISTLKLASCRLTTFPDVRDSKLSFLDLSNNSIRGEVPNWVWRIGNGSLIHLNLSHNKLHSFEEPYTSISLSVIDLRANSFKGKLPKLREKAIIYLDCSENNFTSIPSDIGDRLPFTIFLSLSNNNLTGSIPQSICNATYLQVLDLSSNMLSGEIPSCLFERISSLGVLNLSKNRLRGILPDSFPKSCILETIDVSGNQIQGLLPRSLANCNKLEILDIGRNGIRDEFPCYLRNISSLRVLVLRSNKFLGPVACHESGSSWQMLQIVDIAANNFNGTLPNESLRHWTAMMGNENDTLGHLQFEFLKFSEFKYYQDSITVTSKGLQLQFTKILLVFTSIDLSKNKFEGPIPDALGDVKGLVLLNLSHNAFTGPVPKSLGNLRRLESLDLSSNRLTGKIPGHLSHLSFLGVLNLSYNRLEGKIPIGTQLQSFNKSTFEGNKGLCGPPLDRECDQISSSPKYTHSRGGGVRFHWYFIFTGIGYGVGAGIAVAPIMFWRKAGRYFDESVDRILFVILPLVGLTYKPYDWDTEDEDEEENVDSSNETSIQEELGRKYCIFCSEFDTNWRRVIHDPKCECLGSSPGTIFSSEIDSSSSFSP